MVKGDFWKSLSQATSHDGHSWASVFTANHPRPSNLWQVCGEGLKDLPDVMFPVMSGRCSGLVGRCTQPRPQEASQRCQDGTSSFQRKSEVPGATRWPSEATGGPVPQNPSWMQPKSTFGFIRESSEALQMLGWHLYCVKSTKAELTDKDGQLYMQPSFSRRRLPLDASEICRCAGKHRMHISCFLVWFLRVW